MRNARCPNCSSDVIIDDEACEGDLATCSICESELEITSLSPLQMSALNGEIDEPEIDV